MPSCKAKLRWKEQTGHAIKTFSETCWWLRWEVYHQLLLFFGDIQPFFNNNEDVAPNVMDHLRAVFNDPKLLCRLQLELAAVVDVVKHFVSATYDLEGDSALSLCCYQRVQALCNACQLNVAQMHFSNLHSVAVSLAASYPEVTVDWAETYGKKSIREALHWFLKKFNVELYDTMCLFKAAHLMCPTTVQSLAVVPASVQQLRAFPFIDDRVIDDLAASFLFIWLLVKVSLSKETTLQRWQVRRLCGGETMQENYHTGQQL